MRIKEVRLKIIQRRLGRRVGDLRVAKGLTQAQFARLMKRSVSVIQAWEIGRNFTVKTLYRISTTLRVPLSELFKAPVRPLPKRGRPRRQVKRSKK